jgi:DNA-binding XRE family transcriptional regulator
MINPDAPAAEAQKPIERLAAFIERMGLSKADVARELGVTYFAVYSWLESEHPRVPSWPLRFAIERWTEGEIKALDWKTAEEREIWERVIPFSQRSRGAIANAA